MVRGKKKQVHKTAAASSDPPSQGSSASSPRTSASPRHKPKPLPFTLEQATQNALKCRSKVDAITWEEQVEQVLMRDRYSTEKREEYNDPKRYLHLLDEGSQATLYQHGLTIARLHFDIARMLVQHEDCGGTFEGAWKAMPEEDRYLMIVVGLDATSHGYGFYEQPIRRLCPDLMPNLLSQDGGRGMIELVRFIVQSGLKFGGEDYFSVPSEDFERRYATPLDQEDLPSERPVRLHQASLFHMRNYYVASFVFEVLKQMNYFQQGHLRGALLDKPTVSLEMKDYRSRDIIRGGNVIDARSSIDKALKVADTHFDFETYPGAKVITQASNGGRPLPARLDACGCCRRIRDEVEDLVRARKQLNFCARCMTLDPPHRFTYCSRECQVQDWSTHKLVCGKLFQDPTIPQFGVKPPPSLPPLSIDLQWKLDQHTKPVKGLRTIYCFRCRDEDWARRHPVPDGNISIARYALGILRQFSTSSSWEEEDFTLLLRRAVETRSEEDIKAFVVEAFPHYLGNAPYPAREEGIRELADDWDIDYEKMENWLSVVKSEDIHPTRFINLTDTFGKGEDGRMNGLRSMSEAELDELAALLGDSCEVGKSSKGSRKKKK